MNGEIHLLWVGPEVQRQGFVWPLRVALTPVRERPFKEAMPVGKQGAPSVASPQVQFVLQHRGRKASQQAGGTRPLGASSGQSVPVFLGDHPDSTMYIITQAFNSENAFSEEPASFLGFHEMFCSFRFCAAQVPRGSRLL